MSTKEAFEKGLQEAYDGLAIDSNAVNNMRAYLAAKDAEIAELRRERDQWKHDAQKHSRWVTDLTKSRDELTQELAAVRAEAEKWERLAREFQSQRNEFEADNDRLREEMDKTYE